GRGKPITGEVDVAPAWVRVYVFFFQAEDGIRDWSVTGVQTCALPISSSAQRRRLRTLAGTAQASEANASRCSDENRIDARPRRRSEERRVGKECRARWWRER